MTNNLKKTGFSKNKKKCMIVTVIVQLRINCSISLHKYYRTTQKSSSCSQSKNFPKGGHCFPIFKEWWHWGPGAPSICNTPPLEFWSP